MGYSCFEVRGEFQADVGNDDGREDELVFGASAAAWVLSGITIVTRRFLRTSRGARNGT